jgi:uncharacterized membrane protein YhaH (DUF805 family)
MKFCPQCSASHDISALLCSACGAVMEEPFYQRSVGFCVVLGVVLHLVLRALGFYERFSILEVFTFSTFLLMVLYPAAKLHQKRLRSDRPIVREMLSVHGDRTSRLMLSALLLLGTYYTVRLLTSGRVLELLRPEFSSPQSIFLTLRAWVVVSMSLVGYGLALCIVRSQGLAFFDFRIEHTWREGGRTRGE